MPLNDTEQNNLKLKDLLEEQSIASISKKTNITTEIVEKLLNKDFKSLKKPQVLGGLSIIEREYNVDLSALREESKRYYAENAPDNQEMTVLKPIREEKSVLSKILIIVFLVLIAYGAWYLFTEYYHQKITHMNPPSMKPAKSTVLQEGEPSFINVKVEEHSTSQGSTILAAGVKTNNEKQAETSQSTLQTDEAKKEESRQSIVQGMPVTGSTEQNETMPIAAETVSDETSGSAPGAPLSVSRETIALLPQGVMWFNLFHLGTKKRSYFKRKSKFDIDVKDNGWLFATENARFSFVDNGVTIEFGGTGELFFKLDSTGVHELTADEYRAEEK